MSLSDTLNNAFLNHLLRGTTPTYPAIWYLGWSTTLVTPDGTNVTEVTGGAYARVAVAVSTTNWAAAADSRIENDITISWTTATANWGDITSLVAWDASTSGNVIAWGGITPQEVDTGVTVTYAPGELFLQAA